MGLFRPSRRLTRNRDGSYAVRLPAEERELLSGLAGQLRDLLEESTDDPSVRRLFPTAYHDDEERDRGYQVLARDELRDRRLAAIDIVEATATAERLDEGQLMGWMSAVNDLRLVFGTRLDVSEDMAPIDPGDPRAPELALYEYLGMLLAEIVDALEGGLPPPADEP